MADEDLKRAVPRIRLGEGGDRSFGFHSGAAPPEGVARTHLATAATRGAEMGETTAFAGGAGAPEPIGVIRGTTQTFTPGRLPGHQFAEPEVATPLQAQQAYNRGMLQENLGRIAKLGERVTFPKEGAGTRKSLEAAAHARYGEPRVAGQTLKEIEATKYGGAEDVRKAQAGALTEQTAEAKRKSEKAAEQERTGAFEKRFLREHGTATPKKTGAGYDYAMPRDMNPADYDRAFELASNQG